MDNTSFRVFKETEETSVDFNGEIDLENSAETFGRFVFEPLSRGYADTIGNALRRLLLSSIRGAAVTAVKIDGILHEFTTIPGVREDVIEILINLKHIPVKVINEFPPKSKFKIVTLDTDKLPKDFFTRDVNPGVITAADMPKDADFEFTGNGVLCTLEESAHFTMDIYVEQGAAYLPSERERNSSLPVEAILTDAIFSPVRRVNYRTAPARVGQSLDYERLVLEVWTNGAVEPYAAVKEASEIAAKCFSHIADNIETAEKTSPEGKSGDSKSKNDSDPTALLNRPIHDLELSIRSENCLMRGGVKTVRELLSFSREDLLKIRNLGKKSLDEIVAKIENLGYKLPEGKKSTSSALDDDELEESGIDETLDADESESELESFPDSGLEPESSRDDAPDSQTQDQPQEQEPVEITEPEPEPEPESKAKSKSKRDSKSKAAEPEPESKPESEAEAEPESESKAKPKSKRASNSKSEAAEPGPESKPESEAEAEPESESKAKSKSKRASNSKSKAAESEPESKPEPEAEAKPKSKRTSKSKAAKTDSEPESESAPELKAKSKSKSNRTSKSKAPEQTTESESGTEAKSAEELPHMDDYKPQEIPEAQPMAEIPEQEPLVDEPTAKKSKRGRPKKSDTDEPEPESANPEPNPEPESEPESEAAPKRRGRPKKNQE